MPLIEVDDYDQEDTSTQEVLEDLESDEGSAKAETLELKSLMESATTPRNVADNKAPYHDFKARLGSFTPANYFAMPLQVSPLICAVAGWQMKESSNLLVCQTCEKLLAIKVPQHLSADDKQKLCTIYQEHLWETHADHCPFRVESKRFLQRQVPTNPKMKHTGLIIPFPLARLLPQDSPALMVLERSLRSAFRDRVIELATVIKDSTKTACLSTDVAFYRADDDTSAPPNALENTQDNDSSSDTSLIRRVVSCCNIEKTLTNETATALALLGWDIQAYNHGIICLICCAQRPFEDNATSSASTKRSQWNHVVDSHRYFCPWVSCLPQDSSPLWKILADRILDDKSEALVDGEGTGDEGSTSMDPSKQYFELRKLLDAGVSRKKLKRSRSWDKSS